MVLDINLVKTMRLNDESAFAACYKQLSPLIYSIALRVLSSPSIAEEVMQETFIQAFNSLHQLQEDEKFIGWLKRIAFNKTMNVIRKQKATVEFEEELHSIDTPSLFEAELINQNQLAQLLSILPSKDKFILWLFVVEGYSHKEIAHLTDMTISYSKSVVFRSLTKVRTNHEDIKYAQ